MLKWTSFFPDEYAENTYKIDYQKYYNEGCRGIIYDIDNTLVAHDAPADDRAIAHFEMLRSLGFSFCLLSNNDKPRVEAFNEKIGADIVCKAGKPWRTGYLKAMEQMGTDPEQTMMIGDQIFTDIWGANRTGIRSIMVKRLYPKEEIQIVLKRIPEKIVLLTYFIALRLGWDGRRRHPFVKVTSEKE